MQNEQDHIEAVAYLHVRGKMLKEIEKLLQLKTTKVKNLQAKALAQGLYRETVEFNFEKVSATRLEELRYLDHIEHLQDRLRAISQKNKKQIFQKIHVFNNGSSVENPRDIEMRLAVFGKAAVRPMAEFISQASLIGVSWGATLASVIRELRSIDIKRLHKQRSVVFVPTSGEPYGSPSRANSSSLLAAELDECLGGNIKNRLSLTGIPVVLPKKFVETKESEIIERFMRCCPAYREIFGPTDSKKAPLIDQLETIFTSVGIAELNFRMCGVELCEVGGIARNEFRRVSTGDLGGALLSRSAYPSDEEIQSLAKISSLWAGITKSHYQKIAQRGNRHRGVVVFAIGSNKAHVLVRAIEAGLVNHLVCDQALAWGLCRECGTPGPDEVPLKKHH